MTDAMLEAEREPQRGIGHDRIAHDPAEVGQAVAPALEVHAVMLEVADQAQELERDVAGERDDQRAQRQAAERHALEHRENGLVSGIDSRPRGERQPAKQQVNDTAPGIPRADQPTELFRRVGQRRLRNGPPFNGAVAERLRALKNHFPTSAWPATIRTAL